VEQRPRGERGIGNESRKRAAAHCGRTGDGTKVAAAQVQSEGCLLVETGEVVAAL
jgi:hypothetical protein